MSSSHASALANGRLPKEAPMSTDHRQLGLFRTDPLVGAGLPLWLPDGAIVRGELERLAAEEAVSGGGQRVYTPVLAKRELFERSGTGRSSAFPPCSWTSTSRSASTSAIPAAMAGGTGR
jgi:threonyl-tRNA synthetase